MWITGLLILIVVNSSLLANINLFKQFIPGILLYDGIAYAIFLAFISYQTPDTNNYITTTTGKQYSIEKLTENAHLYIDRGYKFLKVPVELRGATFIQTANDDKSSKQENLFAIIVSKAVGARVYFIFDKRAYDKHGPAWLKGAHLTKLDQLLTTDGETRYVYYTDTISKQQDTIFLGGNQPALAENDPKNKQSSFSMYLFAIKGIGPQQIDNFNNSEKIIHISRLMVNGTDSVKFNEKVEAHEKWIKTGNKAGTRLDLSNTALKNITFYNGDFTGADLSNMRADSSNFNSSIFEAVEFSKSRFTKVNFFNSHLDSANFNKAVLTDCSFLGSDLRGAIFTNVSLKNVDFSLANMAGVIFEPDSIPNVQNISSAYNLDSITYRTDPRALIELQARLKSAGFTEAQRKITAAIQLRKHELKTSALNKFFDYIIFDFTSSYGLNPWRPLVILLAGIYIFYRVYLFIFFIGKLEITIKHEKETSTGKIFEVKDTINPGRLLFLSIITSFSIGFGPYNINDWAKKLLKHDYVLQPRGYTKILIGMQNLISLFLFSLTVLLLFSDPFIY